MSNTIKEYSLAFLMQKIESVLNANPEPIHGFNAIYQFDIDGGESEKYQLHFQYGNATIKKEAEISADCTLQMSLENFHLFLLGKLNGTMAFMTGKLKIKGDIGKAMKIENILRQYSLKDQL